MTPNETIDLERCRILIPSWPEVANDDLAARLQTLSSLAQFYGSAPAVVGHVFIWTGWILGGMVPVAETILGYTDERPTTILVTDDELDLAFQSEDDRVLVLGSKRTAEPVDRSDLRQALHAASDGADFRERLILRSLSSTPMFSSDDDPSSAMPSSVQREPGAQLGDRVDRVVNVAPPGVLDLDLLEEATLTLEAEWDPDSLESCSLTVSTYGGATLVIWPPTHAPLHSFGIPLDDSRFYLWYAAQWSRDNDIEDPPAAHGPLALADVAQRIEHDELLSWMMLRTTEALASYDEHELPVDALRAVRQQLERDRKALAAALEPSATDR